MKLPVTFILLMIGVILLLLNLFPFIGWFFLIYSFIMGIVSLSFSKDKNLDKHIKIVIVALLAILGTVIIIYSFSNIIISIKQTINQITGFASIIIG